MSSEFVARVIRVTLVVALTVALFTATYMSPLTGLGLLVGALWSCVNLFVTGHVVRSVIGSEKPSKRRVVKLSLVKFPVLYGSGFLLLRSGVFSPQSLVAGFSLVLLVILMKAVGASVAERASSARGHAVVTQSQGGGPKA